MRNPAGVSDIFADNLGDRFKPLNLTPMEKRMLVQLRLDRPFQMALVTEPVTLEEVVTKIGKLKNKKLHSRTCWTTKR